MKKIQDYRFITQLLCTILLSISAFLNFKIVALIILVSTILSGVFFCGWICPFGFVQDTMDHIGTAFGIKKRKMPKSLHKFLRLIRYILAALVILSTSDLLFSILSFDPRANLLNIFSGNLISTIGVIILILFSLISIFFQRPFCNYFCTQGAKYSILSLLRPITIKRNEKCVGCKKCDTVCPMNIEVSKADNLRNPNCINCFKCISNCPIEGALTYGKVKFDKKEIKKYFLIITTFGMLTFAYLGYNTFVRKNSSNVKETALVNEMYVGKVNIGKNIPDGSYTGSSKGYKGTVTVKVTVKDEKLTNIEIISYEDDKRWFERAKNSIVTNIIQNQTTDVDTVAGATYSSLGIKNSIINALKNAK